jgi:hypothetical protein
MIPVVMSEKKYNKKKSNLIPSFKNVCIAKSIITKTYLIYTFASLGIAFDLLLL